MGFGANVICYDVKKNKRIEKWEQEGKDEEKTSEGTVRYVNDLDELFHNSDVISLHLPLLDSTRHIVSSSSISKMKKGVFLLNTSRGPLIETKALLDGLKSGRIGAAGIDVYEEEEGYFYKNHEFEMIQDEHLRELISLPNILLTSHQGFLTNEAMKAIASTTLKNIKSCMIDGKKMKECSNSLNEMGEKKKGGKEKEKAKEKEKGEEEKKKRDEAVR